MSRASKSAPLLKSNIEIAQAAGMRLSNGAEFLVVCGDIMTMPGLPRHPSAHNIKVDGSGKITGLL